MRVGNFSWMNSEGFRLFLGVSVLAGFTTYMSCRRPDYLKSTQEEKPAIKVNDRLINKQSYDRSNSSK